MLYVVAVAIAEVEPEPGPWKEYKKHPGKKRLRRQENWARKKAKMARNEGKSYTDRKGTIHPAKRLKEYNHNCRYKCSINIPEEKRKSIFDSYWKLGSWDLQTAFLCSCISLEDPVKRGVGHFLGQKIFFFIIAEKKLQFFPFKKIYNT